MLSYPKISCTTVTLGRVPLIKKSIDCYRAQTYKNKEMIILSQGKAEDNAQIEAYIRSLGRDDIKLYTTREDTCLGAMRNLSVELATGEVVCQWDDDDLYHPYRLVTQYNALREEACQPLYMEHLKYFKNTGDMYWIDWSIEGEERRSYLCGTAMYYKRTFERAGNMLYPEAGSQCHVEEDWNALDRLIEFGRIAPIREGYQYIYVYHGDNIYDLDHHKLVLDKRVRDVEFLRTYRVGLENTFKSVGIDTPVAMRSLDEVAFEWTTS